MVTRIPFCRFALTCSHSVELPFCRVIPFGYFVVGDSPLYQLFSFKYTVILSRACHPSSCKQITEAKTGVIISTSLFRERYLNFYGKENQVFRVFKQEELGKNVSDFSWLFGLTPAVFLEPPFLDIIFLVPAGIE